MGAIPTRVMDWRHLKRALRTIMPSTPVPEDDPNWVFGIRHSAIVYKPSSIANAAGPIITDPKRQFWKVISAGM
jgi:hypothetical protein